MSVQGPTPQPFRPYAPAVPAGARPPVAARPAGAPAAAAPAAAPADGSLLQLLTDDEREFFAQQATLGALTYGRARGSASAPASQAIAPIGQRLDVRA